MKRSIYFAFLVAAPGICQAQGLINNGAYIVMSGASSNIYIDGAAGNYTASGAGRIDPLTSGATVTLLGNWVNNSSTVGFGFDGSTVNFSGANQSIGGSQFTHFYNVNLLGSGTKTLNVQTHVGGFGATPTGVLSLGSRPLNLNGFNLWQFNPAVASITNTTGYIQSETNSSLNPSIVRWYAGTNALTYTVPFGVAGTQIPLSVAITSAMSASTSYFEVSTRATAGTNNTPWASTVTHMFDPTLAQDGSDEAVVDRWWEFTWSNAATANVTFRYRGSENTLQVPYNTGNLGAQYWAGGWLPDNSTIGSAPSVLVGVGSVTASGLAFPAATYRPWVLSSVTAPLPIELTDFKAACDGKNEILSWATASELNNDYFTVERSDDGLNFHAIGTVSGAGTSSQLHTYNFTDPQAITGNTYYRLRQTDYNGNSTTTKLIEGEACGSTDDFTDAYSSGADVYINMHVSLQGDYAVGVFDARGRKVISESLTAAEGENHFRLGTVVPSTGIYLVEITGSNGKSFSKRLYINRD